MIYNKSPSEVFKKKITLAEVVNNIIFQCDLPASDTKLIKVKVKVSLFNVGSSVSS